MAQITFLVDTSGNSTSFEEFLNVRVAVKAACTINIVSTVPTASFQALSPQPFRVAESMFCTFSNFSMIVSLFLQEGFRPMVTLGITSTHFVVAGITESLSTRVRVPFIVVWQGFGSMPQTC